MRKRYLKLDKELLTSNQSVAGIDGGSTPSIVFSVILTVSMLDPECGSPLTSFFETAGQEGLPRHRGSVAFVDDAVLHHEAHVPQR